MRTLKKTLSLVLVLAMVFSFCAMGTNAAFADADKIDAKYAEAVAVMNGLEILKGDEAGFRPGDTLTRAEACVIVIKMLGDLELAKTAKTDAFSDITGHWGEKYIAYCYEQGLISGMGDGTFAPDAELSGYAFALMMLRACGYDPKVEGIGGAGWELATTKLAKRAGLISSVDMISAETFTREIAAQMAFDCLNDVDQVYYPTALGVATTYDAPLGAAFQYFWTTEFDAAGVEYKVWIQYNEATAEWEPITEPVVANTLVGTYTETAKYADIAKELGINKYSTAYYTVTENGVLDGDLELIEENYYFVATENPAVALLSSKETVPANTTLTVYRTAEGNFSFIYVEEDLAQATVSEKADEDPKSETYGLYTWTFKNLATTTVATVYGAKDAYVDEAYYLVAIDDGYYAEEDETPFLSIELAESVEGKVTSMDKEKTYAFIDGTKYATASAALAEVEVTGEYTLYFNSNGNVIGAVEVKEEVPETVDTFAVVTGFYALKVEGTSTAYGETAATSNHFAQCVDMTGAEVSYLIGTEKATSDVSGYDYAEAFVLVGTPDAKGVITLTPVDPANNEKNVASVVLDAEKDLVAVTGINYFYADAEYVRIVITEGKLDKLVCGEGTLAEAALNDCVVLYTVDKADTGKVNRTVTTVVYIVEHEYKAPYAGGVIYAINEDCDTVEIATDDKGNDYKVYVHTVYIDGVKTEIKMTGAGKDVLTQGAFYTFAIDSKTGYYTLKLIDGENTDIDVEEVIAPTKVTNVYGKYVSFGSQTNLDTTDITIVDLRDKGDGKLAKDAVVTCIVENTTAGEVITIIYIVG